jgi:hypothetical protein
MSTSSPGVTRLSDEAGFYLNQAFRRRLFLWNFLSLTVLGVFSIWIIVEARGRISMASIVWMVFAMYWAIQLFRLVLNTHASVSMLLAVAQVEQIERKSPMGKVLDALGEISHRTLIFCSLIIICLLMSIVQILSGH